MDELSIGAVPRSLFVLTIKYTFIILRVSQSMRIKYKHLMTGSARLVFALFVPRIWNCADAMTRLYVCVTFLPDNAVNNVWM